MTIPGEGDGAPNASIEVEADNWFSALRNGLTKHGMDGRLVSNITCDIQADGNVLVTDFVSRKVFTLRPIEPGEDRTVEAPAPAAAQAAPPPAAAPETAPPDDRQVIPALPDNLAMHNVFFWRDEDLGDGSGIFYRERLVSVSPDLPAVDAARLSVAYFERLKAMGSPPDSKLFITVQVFDHEFGDRSVRPAVSSLTWKEWSPKKARVQFPLSGADVMTISMVPPPPPQGEEEPQPAAAVADPSPAPSPPEPVSAPAILSDMVGEPAAAPQPEPEGEDRPLDLVPVARPSAPVAQPSPQASPVDLIPRERHAEPAPIAAEEPRPVDLVPAPRPEPSRTPRHPTPIPLEIARAVSEPGGSIEDAIVVAFERMQDIYTVRDHDGAAAFALDLCMEFVECEAGSAMLITPGKYELYIAAAEGPVSDRMRGKKLSLTKGIIGFATRTGAVVTVTDPANDPRFHAEFDEASGFDTRNVVCAPIQHEGRTIGAIELINSPRPGGFLQGEANVISYIAGAVGEYIDRSLPSREADFSDKEFLEFLPAKKQVGAKGGQVSKKSQPPTRGAAPAAGAGKKTGTTGRAGAKKTKTDTRAETPSSKKKTKSGSGGKTGGAKRKKKRKR